jgi:tRNA pseudouridine32 synthase/23S rRNA pseudouridine746 synthase
MSSINDLFHLLSVDCPQSVPFTNPFYYEPDAACRRAMRQIMDLLDGREVDGWSRLSPAFLQEARMGKMFGVLVATNPADGQTGFLAGYSGQLGGRSDWPQWVPAVVDYLQPDGYFKMHEQEISLMNRRIRELENGPERRRQQSEVEALRLEGDAEIAAFRQQMQADKARRDAVRASLSASGEDGERQDAVTEAALIRESQYQKAELRRLKKRWLTRLQEAESRLRQSEERLEVLRRERRQKSDNLQRWLFDQFVMVNAKGERLGLREIFARYGALHGQPGLEPPSGSGECCEPRLLQTAYLLGLRPVSMAMFWWGESPREEVRHAGRCYPACQSKCKPLLWWMLQGLDVAPNPLELSRPLDLPVVYEDEALSVVCKPAGMLSVPGKLGLESVESIMRRRYGGGEEPIIVHRLDMDTSGLMVVARTPEAYHRLQEQFLCREVHKRYEALLEHPLSREAGEVSLPLRPDLDDRPRQVVDALHGRPAVTRFQRIGERRVALWPLTGRTHQLRVHCAHRDGLDDPICGDALYGTRGDRLCLHAAELSFRHPITGAPMSFSSPAPF